MSATNVWECLYLFITLSCRQWMNRIAWLGFCQVILSVTCSVGVRQTAPEVIAWVPCANAACTFFHFSVFSDLMLSVNIWSVSVAPEVYVECGGAESSPHLPYKLFALVFLCEIDLLYHTEGWSRAEDHCLLNNRNSMCEKGLGCLTPTAPDVSEPFATWASMEMKSPSLSRKYLYTLFGVTVKWLSKS